MADLVTQISGIRGGEPCIRGSRIPVRTLVFRHLSGESVESLANNFNQTESDVRGALAWAASRVGPLHDRALLLPVTFELGAKFSIRRGAATEDARGQYDPETGEIVIDESCDPLGEVCVLIHEMMHAAECGMLENGTLTEHIDHPFIHAAAYGAAVALAEAGAIHGVGPDEIDAFLGAAEAESEGGEAPHVCPGCHAVDEECAPGCIDAEIEAERRHAIEGGDYESGEDDDG